MQHCLNHISLVQKFSSENSTLTKNLATYRIKFKMSNHAFATSPHMYIMIPIPFESTKIFQL